MNAKDVKDAVKWMRELFPTLTDAQAILIGEELLKFPLNEARQAIREHRFMHEFLDFPQFKNALLAIRRATVQNSSEEREKERGQRELLEGARRVVAGMSDEDLARLKAAAMENMTEDERAWYDKRDPRRTTSLALAIVELAR